VKIEKTSSNPLTSAPNADGRARAPSARTQGNASSATPASSTSVNLGATSVQLRDMESTAANSPVVNSAKVAEIRQAISEGRFQVNAGVVADSLIQSVTDLLGSQRTGK